MTQEIERSNFESELLTCKGITHELHMQRDGNGDYALEWVQDRYEGWQARARVGKGEVGVLIEAIESLDAAWSREVDRQDMNCISAQLEHKENDAKIAKYKTVLAALSAKPVEAGVLGEVMLTTVKMMKYGGSNSLASQINTAAQAILERFNVTEK